MEFASPNCKMPTAVSKGTWRAPLLVRLSRHRARSRFQIPPHTLTAAYSMAQTNRTLQETVTTLGAGETLGAAKGFFARQNGIYAAFPEQESPSHVTLRGQGGEEVVIGVAPAAGGTRVTGSTYLFDQQVARFFATLPTPV